MEQLARGSVVRSAAGRDKGGFFVVLSVEGGYAYLCDGKRRPLDRPKKKKQIHLSETNTVVQDQSIETNREILKALSGFYR